jgi:gliding motility-associated-like protein
MLSICSFTGDRYEYRHTISGALEGQVLYYKVVSIDAANNFSVASAIGSTDGTIIQTKSDPVTGDKIAEVIIPGNVSSILYKEVNAYNDDLEVVISNNSAREQFNESIRAVGIVLREIMTNENITSVIFPAGDVEIRIYFKVNNGVIENSDVQADAANSKLGIYYYNELGREWILIGGRVNVVDSSLGYVSVKVGHLTEFKVGLASRSTVFKLVKIEPSKIFTPNNDGVDDTIKFIVDYPDGQTANFSGKIFDMTGRLIRDSLRELDSKTVEWDGKDSGGTIVTQGVYMYQIEGIGKKVTGTVIIAR